MSAFTDDKLEKLKSDLEKHIVIDLIQDDGLSLLARLEAAESALMRFHSIPKDEWTSGIREAVDKWRKAQGE
jgi:hypothetical protein